MTDKVCRITFSKQVMHIKLAIHCNYTHPYATCRPPTSRHINIHHTCITLCTSSLPSCTCTYFWIPWCIHILVAARHTAPAGGNVIHFIFHCALVTSQVHPKSAGLGNCGALIVAWPHIWPASYPILNTCWASGSASYVGGIFFRFP